MGTFPIPPLHPSSLRAIRRARNPATLLLQTHARQFCSLPLTRFLFYSRARAASYLFVLYLKRGERVLFVLPQKRVVRYCLGSIFAAFSSPIYVPPREESSGKERGLLSRTAAGNRPKRLLFVRSIRPGGWVVLPYMGTWAIEICWAPKGMDFQSF